MKKIKSRWPVGLLVLAIAATIYGGGKSPSPPPPKPKIELVIIIEPLPDGMYSTRYLHITKEQANELQNQN